MFLWRCLPSLDPSCHFLFIRVFLKFFLKNQVFTPDVFKSKLQTSLLRKKRSFQEFQNAKNNPKSTENLQLQKTLVLKKPKVSSNLNFECQTKRTEIARTNKTIRESNEPIQNLFCFMKNFMRNSSVKLMNIGEVCKKLLNKLGKLDLKGTSDKRKKSREIRILRWTFWEMIKSTVKISIQI